MRHHGGVLLPTLWLRDVHALPLTYEQFRFANAVGEDEGKDLYATFAVPASGVPPFQAATADLNPWNEKVDRGHALTMTAAGGKSLTPRSGSASACPLV